MGGHCEEDDRSDEEIIYIGYILLIIRSGGMYIIHTAKKRGKGNEIIGKR